MESYSVFVTGSFNFVSCFQVLACVRILFPFCDTGDTVPQPQQTEESPSSGKSVFCVCCLIISGQAGLSCLFPPRLCFQEHVRAGHGFVAVLRQGLALLPRLKQSSCLSFPSSYNYK